MNQSQSSIATSSASLQASWKMRSEASTKAFAVFFFAMLLSAGSLCSIAGTAVAQNQRIHHTVVKQHLSPPAMGREFWWAQPSNYWGEDLGGKYIRVYITSPQNTTAFVSIGANGPPDPVPVEAYKIGSYKVNLGWEMESSGIVQPKAIHVYSKDADLTVYVMSHNAYTSDGSYIIPTIGWGTDYVVAAFGALFEGSGAYVYDLPSEFTITANVDNTTVEVTPSTDLRQCYGRGDNPSVVAYPQGRTFTVQLQRGECVQYMSVKAQGTDNYDVTGTVIHSNNPVGIIGGSGCPNIPADFPYCDHVEDMIPPIRTWATTYYTTNFVQPPTMPGHDFGLYLMISSKPGQTIYRSDYQSGTHTECIIDNKYGTYWDELELAQKFWSDAPFLLVEYINSATYPDNQNGAGDPAEVVINPREQYTKTVVFQTPISIGAQSPYDNYANITVNINDEKKTLFDGQKITSYTRQPIDGKWEIFNIPHIAPGAHTIIGDDSGVGVYIYGYGYDESYGWTGSFGTGTFHAQDTVAPRADTSGECYTGLVHLYDFGTNPGGIPQSKLSEVRLDSDYNMAYQLDPSWHEGAGIDSTYYGEFVVDRTKPAYLRVDAFDQAGNETTVTSTYTPQTADVRPPLTNLGASIAGTIKYGYDTLVNTGKVPFNFDQLSLLYGNVGFTIDSGMTPPQLAVGEKRILKIAFQAVKTSTVVDSIIFGDECGVESVAVVGSGGSADFLVSDQKWLNEPVPPPAGGYVKTVTVENLSTIPITIDKGWWADNTHFVAVDTFPLGVPATDVKTGKPGSAPFRIAYFPDTNSLKAKDRTQGNWTSPNVKNSDGSESIRNDSLIGNGVAPSESFVQDIDDTVECAQPGDVLHLSFLLGEVGTTGNTINRVTHTDTTAFINLVGTLSSGTSWDPQHSAQPFAPGETATLTLDYPVPAGTNVTATDSLYAINAEGDTIMGHPIKVQVHVIYRAGQVQPAGAINFGTTPYQGPLVTRSFVITNSTQAPLAINNISQPAGGKYSNAYTVTTVPAMPDTLQPGDFMTVTVTFNDSLSFDAVQTSELNVDWNACAPQSIPLIANTTVSGAVPKGYIPTPILSCDQTTNNDTIFNTQPHDEATGSYVIDTVISATWIGVNHGANFSIPDVKGDTIRSGSSLLIPVTFIPGSQQGLVTYMDSLQVILRNDEGIYDTLIQPNSGIAGTTLVSANSQFATTDSGAANDEMSIPATISVNKRGLIIPTVQMGITGIQLTYVIPHPDLLIPNTPSPFTLDPNFATAGWSSSIVPNSAGVRSDSLIVVKLSGSSPLTDQFNTSKLGQLQFRVALDKSDNATPVTLASVQLFTGPNGSTAVGSCIDTATSSGGFSLILRCGDSTLRGVMNGQGVISFIRPATPDPVTGSTVTFEYANRGETNITLAIFDVLGHEVARPVDNVNHDAGAWQVSYDASKLSSGTYTYRLSSSNGMGKTAISKQFVIQR